MKSLLISLSLLSAPAIADTITLGPDACGLVKQCYAIPNDAGADVTLLGATGYPYFFIYIDGVQYTASQPSGLGFDSIALQAADGSTIIASGSFATYRTCTRSGRGQHCSTHWSFAGGTLVR